MLSLFPALLSYQQLSPFLLRIILGAIFLFAAYRSLRGGSSNDKKVVAAIEALAALLLVIGLWTQAAAAIITIDLVARLIGRIREKAFLTDGVNYYLILLAIAISLLLTGPGWWAFDLPL